MTVVTINGESLEVRVDAAVPLDEAARVALALHRSVCRGIAAREAAIERREASKADIGPATAGQIVHSSHQGNPYGFAWRLGEGEQIEVDANAA